MNKDYYDAVVNDYYTKVEARTISLNLSPLTPANVKMECKALCEQPLQKRDEQILNAFLGLVKNPESYVKVFERCDIDKFKPLINFVEGKSKRPNHKHVELLAWLIGFNDRPFNMYGKYGGANNPHIVTPIYRKPFINPDPITGVGDPPLPAPLTNQPISLLKGDSRRAILVIALIVALFTLTIKTLPESIVDNYVPKDKKTTDSAVVAVQDTIMPSDQVKDVKYLSIRKWGIYGQCQAPTKKKTRCLRNAKANGVCWQHQNSDRTFTRQ